ncbi:hypothetical protein [Pedobacter steynii]
MIDQAKRASQMEKVFAMPGKLDFTEKKAKTAKVKSTGSKAKVEKAPKVDTKELSLVLLKEGKLYLKLQPSAKW